MNKHRRQKILFLKNILQHTVVKSVKQLKKMGDLNAIMAIYIEYDVISKQ